MEELLQKVAEIRGLPASMVQRSAEARAKAQGVSVEEVLREWAGEEGAAVPPAAAPPPVAAESATAAAPAEAEPVPAETAPAEEEVATSGVEVLLPEAAAPEAAAADGAVAEPSEAGDTPSGDEIPALSGGFPRWLAAALVVLPAIGLLYALIAPGGPDCGVSGALAIDPSTGIAANCDGTPYGAEPGPFDSGGATFAAQCATCHGNTGGGAVGPRLSGGSVLLTFSKCADHIAWVTTGSNAWPEPTYGDPGKPVLGSGTAMPGFGSLLTADEIAAVVLYERVTFGEEPLSDAEAECLAPPAG